MSIERANEAAGPVEKPSARAAAHEPTRRDPSAGGSTSAAGRYLAVQRAAGNRATTGMIQAKLSVGPAGDRYEQEADEVATAVVRSLQRQPAGGPADDEDAGSRAPRGPGPAGAVHRMIQAQADGPVVGLEGGVLDAETDLAINRARGGGAALAEPVRRSMEAGFGADFSAVRIHNDAGADGLNQRIQAKAFTTGRDIFFRAGEYNPGTPGGQHLLAHELTHVVQQGGAPAQRQVQRAASPEHAVSRREGGSIQRELGDLGQGAAKSKASSYPSAAEARDYMGSLGGSKAGKQWRELTSIAGGRDAADTVPLLAQYCWALSQPAPADPAELPAFKAKQESWRNYLKPVAEKIALAFKQKNLYAFRTGAETDFKKNRELITKGGKSEAKNFYFWSMTQSYADEEAKQQQGTTLESSAAGSMWVNRAFADPNDAWCGAPGRLDRIIFEAMSSHYAATAEEVIHSNKQNDPSDTSVIKILQYRGINMDTAFYTEEWDKVKTSGLPYQFAIYLFSGSPTAAGWPAGGVFKSPEFKDVKMYDKGLSEHYVKKVGSLGTEAPPVWNFKDQTDERLRYGGMHVNGKGPEEPGHDKPTRAWAEIPAAYLNNQLVGKDPQTGEIYLMKPDGSKGALYAADENAAIALSKSGAGSPP